MTNLVRVSRGLWRPADALTTLAEKAAALLRVCPPGTVLAGITAARLHRLWLPWSDWVSERIEVIVRPELNPQQLRSYSRRAELRARRQQLLPDEVTDIDGLPCCTEARCWLDLAARMRPADLVALGDSALRGSATMAEMEKLIGRARHRRGVVLARRVLPLLDARSRSRPESHLRFVLVDAGLPRPAVNEPVYDEFGGWLGEPDLSYDDVGLAIEYNGARHADVDRMRKDITRELDFELRGGWRSVVFGPSEVFDHPDLVVAHVSRLRHVLSGHLDR